MERKSALTKQHLDLGAGLEIWNGMPTPWRYASRLEDEHDAVRQAAGLFDMSAIKKLRVRGEDAASVIDHVVTRNVASLPCGRSTYTSILNESGFVCDDAIVFNNGPGDYLLCHGAGEGTERVQESALGRKLECSLDDSLSCLMLQGPRSRLLLDRWSTIDLASLKYFHHQPTEVFGHPCMISRTSYSGELGYEIFSIEADTVRIWENILEDGAGDGVMACSFSALNTVRVEAGLLFYGYDMAGRETPWEAGLGFTVDKTKREFRGMQQALRSEGRERFVLAGIVAEHLCALSKGTRLHYNGADVGVVNSPIWSHRMNKSLALSHVRPDLAVHGTRLTTGAPNEGLRVTVVRIPFYDPDKIRVRM